MLQNKDIVMTILLPDQDVELQSLENNFEWKTLAEAPSFIEDVELHLPKFKFEVTLKLEEPLRKVHDLKNVLLAWKSLIREIKT